MTLFRAVLIVVIVEALGLLWNMDRPFLTNQSQISQASAADVLKVNSTPKFTQKELSKKRFRTLWNIFKSEPWRLSRRSG